MKNIQIRVVSNKLSSKKISEIQDFVDKLCENNMGSVAIATNVGKKFNCTIGLKYNPEVDYIELNCYNLI